MTEGSKETQGWRSLAVWCLGAGLWLAGTGAAQAGDLLALFDRVGEDHPALESERYRALAAEQAVITQRREYYPSATVYAKNLWVDQRVEQSDVEVLPRGREEFRNYRVMAEVEQPLFDATIAPGIRAAEARHRHRQQAMARSAGEMARQTIEGYLQAARRKSVLRSLERVIQRLEKEEQVVSKNFEEKLATLSDVETVKRNLVHTRRDHSILSHELQQELKRLGLAKVGPEWGLLRDDAKAETLAVAAGSPLAADPEADELRMEVTELTERASAIRRRALPRVNLIGRYELDDADNSIFGGARDIESYEVGVALEWDLLEGGRNRSEAMEMDYLRLAKEAELRAIEKAAAQSVDSSEQVDLRVAHCEALRAHQAAILDAAQRAYEAGTQSYISALDAFILHESSVRDWEQARFEQLIHRVRTHAAATTWDRDLAGKVDALFVAAKN